MTTPVKTKVRIPILIGGILAIIAGAVAVATGNVAGVAKVAEGAAQIEEAVETPKEQAAAAAIPMPAEPTPVVEPVGTPAEVVAPQPAATEPPPIGAAVE